VKNVSLERYHGHISQSNETGCENGACHSLWLSGIAKLVLGSVYPPDIPIHDNEHTTIARRMEMDLQFYAKMERLRKLE
jgi:hypothetical protein